MAQQKIEKQYGLGRLMELVEQRRDQEGTDWVQIWQCHQHSVSIAETSYTADWLIRECWDHVTDARRALGLPVHDLGSSNQEANHGWDRVGGRDLQPAVRLHPKVQTLAAAVR